MDEQSVLKLVLVAAFVLSCWWGLKDVWRKIVYCNFRGHTVKESVMDRLGDGRDEIETKCEKCGFPLLVYADPAGHYMVTDAW